ncbi:MULTISPECIES: GNAT family N-acetyltransferase [Shewanella]|jgi:ribosomal protein S18 acetylase RimI-like enzyme|uniref:GNAT family N-acetyltransferase n=2 Tax=Shewanella TaxID=22 RepID=A0AAJ1FAF4_9GAMM|nr:MULTISPECIES: GNAT family N-acetyltransferase [Shewanella]AZQ10941.1 Acetyltransferase (GNAT) family protein [Shewanella khirikhana]MCH4294050.1 GNAT family N-acetyltransferase [Shewanella zhuhaiensis]
MQIRLASENDLDNLVPLFNAYRQSLGKESDPIGVREFIASRLCENDSVIFVALDEHNAVGFIQLYPSFSSLHLKPIWYFDDSYVTPAYRDRGVAQMLADKAMELAGETDVLIVRRTLVDDSTSVALDTDTGDRNIYQLLASR